MSKLGTPREPVWTDQEVAYLREHYGRVPVREIAEALGRSYRATALKAMKNGLQARSSPREWSEADTEYLAASYEHMPTMEIAKALGRRHATIKCQADKLGLLSVKRRASAAIRHDYFAYVARPIQAYVLGLLASDGWVSSSGNELGIDLHAKDACLVELVRDELAPRSRVVPRPSGDRTGFRVTSPQMKSDLGRLSVTPRKSYTLRWPDLLPGELAASFILGVFDGDGSLGYDRKRKYYRWSIVSASRPFLEEIQARVLAGAGVKIRGPYGTGNGSRTLSIEYIGPKTHLIDEWLHADVPGLARKRIEAAP